jgi:hypothetical protein
MKTRAIGITLVFLLASRSCGPCARSDDGYMEAE